MKTLWQVFAIARTEFRFGLRRGAPVVVTALVGLVVAAGILINPLMNLEGWSANQDLTPATVEMLASIGITTSEYLSLGRNLLADMTILSTPGGWFLMFLALLLLPVATAMVIPADQKFGVLELLKSTPLGGGTYLVGKLLGVVGIVSFIAIIPLLLFFIVLQIAFFVSVRVGVPVYAVKFYLELAFMDGLPLFVWAASIGVLVGVGFRSRRAAILPGFIAGALGLLFWLIAFKAPPVQFATADVAAYYIFQGYRSIAQETIAKMFGSDSSLITSSLLGDGAPVVRIGQVLLMYAGLLVVLFSLTVLARLWLKWKENF